MYRFDDEKADEDFDEAGSENSSEEEHTESNSKLNASRYKKYLDEVFRLRPNIKQIYDETSSIDFYNYSKKHIRENRNHITRARKPELISVVQEKVRSILGSKVANSVAHQLKGNDSVSTAQHTAPLGHYVLKYTLQSALPYFNTPHPNLQNVIVFSCSMISFNNSSTPRTLLVHTKDPAPSTQIPFFGRSVDAIPVYNFPAYTYETIEHMKKEAFKLHQDGKLGQDQFHNLTKLIEKTYGSEHALSQQTFMDQISVTGYYNFKKIFSNYKKSVPNYIFLSQEEISTNLILKFHLNNKTTIGKILFEEKMQQLMEKNFENVSGAFSVKKQKGTYLFWGIHPENKLRLQLWKQGNFLVSHNEKIKIELTPEAIKEALEKREIVPSVMLTFFLLAFYYGLFLTGAFRQTYDLEVLKGKYIKMLEEYGGEGESIQAVEGLITSNLILPSSTLYMEYPDGYHAPATVVDILINPEKRGNWEAIFESFKKIPYSELITKTFPVVYNRFIKEEEKDPKLASITERDIDKFTTFYDRVPSIVKP